VTALVSQLTTGYSNPDGPEGTPGPVNPYVRRALERSVASVARNPEPLPPRSAFLAAVIVEFAERMTLVGEIADLLPRPGGEPGHIIVAGHVAKFLDEICGNGFKLRWPFPWPAPAWFNVGLNGADLVVMGTQFQQCAGLAIEPDLGRTFADAAHALLEAGTARYV
jgi:nucleotide-binding universal stress UspA family protein